MRNLKAQKTWREHSNITRFMKFTQLRINLNFECSYKKLKPPISQKSPKRHNLLQLYTFGVMIRKDSSALAINTQISAMIERNAYRHPNHAHSVFWSLKFHVVKTTLSYLRHKGCSTVWGLINMVNLDYLQKLNRVRRQSWSIACQELKYRRFLVDWTIRLQWRKAQVLYTVGVLVLSASLADPALPNKHPLKLSCTLSAKASRSHR